MFSRCSVCLMEQVLKDGYNFSLMILIPFPLPVGRKTVILYVKMISFKIFCSIC